MFFHGDCFCSRLYPVYNATSTTWATYQHIMYRNQPIAAYRRNLLSPLKKVHVSREVRVNDAVKKSKREVKFWTGGRDVIAKRGR